MKKEVKITLLIVALLAFIGLTAYLYMSENVSFAIITAAFTVICAISLVNTLITNRSVESAYQAKVKSILKTYDAILVKSNNLPKLNQKNIIIVETIEDLVDAQMEIRKPICYQQQTESCAFVLLDNVEAYVYITKLNDQVKCPLEITLNEIEIKQKQAERKEDLPDEVLKDIERTTIVRLNKDQYVKVSPVRRKHNEATQDLKEVVKEAKKKIEKEVEEVKEDTSKIEAEAKEAAKKAVKKAIELKKKEDSEKAAKKEIKKETKKEVKEEVKEVADKAIDKAFEVKEVANNIKEAVEDKVEEIKEEVKKEETKEKVEEVIDKAADKIEEVKEQIEVKAEEIKEAVEEKATKKSKKKVDIDDEDIEVLDF